MNWLKNVAQCLGAAVDAAFPWFVGARTKVAVVACPVLQVGKGFVPDPYKPVVDLVEGVLCAAAPALALAGLVRK